MKTILSAALVLGFCGLAGAADDKKVDPVGTWKCEYKIGDQKRTARRRTKVLQQTGHAIGGCSCFGASSA